MKDILQYLARLPVMSNQECQRTLRQTLRDSFQRQFPRGVSRGFICAAFREGNKDACGVRNIISITFKPECKRSMYFLL